MDFRPIAHVPYNRRDFVQIRFYGQERTRRSRFVVLWVDYFFYNPKRPRDLHVITHKFCLN